MATALQEKAAVVERKRGELKTFMDAHKVIQNGNPVYDFNEGQLKEFNDRNDELAKFHQEYVSMKAVYAAAEDNDRELKAFEQPADDVTHPGVTRPGIQEKSLGDLFVEMGAHKADNKGKTINLAGVNVKTLMSTTAGIAPEVVRNRELLLSAQRPIRLLDLIPMRDINQTAIKYLEETTFTNNAAEIAEGAAYAEAALQTTEQTSIVRKIGVLLPVTDEQLEDEAYIRQYINDRLTYMLRNRLEGQTIVGNGTAPNLRGILNYAGIQTQALGADTVFDTWLKAFTKIETGPYAEPDLGMMHPTNLTNMRLTKDLQGRYLMGDPNMPGPINIWGYPIAKSTAITLNTGIAQDTKFLEMALYRGVEVKVTDSSDDDFRKGRQLVRADIRVMFHNYRPSATCTATGLP